MSVAISPTRIGSGTNILKSLRHKTAATEERGLWAKKQEREGEIRLSSYYERYRILIQFILIYFSYILPCARMQQSNKFYSSPLYLPLINSSEKMTQYADNKYSAPNWCLLFRISLQFFSLLPRRLLSSSTASAGTASAIPETALLRLIILLPVCGDKSSGACQTERKDNERMSTSHQRR